VALGLDQGANGDAWGYDIGAQRVTLTAAGLPWPHYFVDLSGIGGSADPDSDLVVIAACAQLAPGSPASASPSSASPSGSPSGTPTSTPAQTATAPESSAGSGSASSTPSPSASPSAPGQGCLRPELVALNL
jgi:hypothetical protein